MITACAFCFGERQLNVAARRRELDGIRQEVVDDLAESYAVCLHDARATRELGD